MMGLSTAFRMPMEKLIEQFCYSKSPRGDFEYLLEMYKNNPTNIISTTLKVIEVCRIRLRTSITPYSFAFLGKPIDVWPIPDSSS